MWKLNIDYDLIFVLLLFSQSFHHWKGIKMMVLYILFCWFFVGTGFFSLLTQTLFCVVAAPGVVPSLFNPAIWVGVLFYFVLSCWFLAVASTSNFVYNEQNRRKTNTIAKYVIILCFFPMLFVDHMHIICHAAKSIWASVNYLWDCNSFMTYSPIYFVLNGLVMQLGKDTGKGLWTKFLLN